MSVHRRASLSLLSLFAAAVMALSLPVSPAQAQNAYFFPQAVAASSSEPAFDPAIPTPEQFLGYPIGSRYTRHDQLVAYFQELARHSQAIRVQQIGQSYEGRPLLVATVTAAANQARLEQIRQQHATLVDPAQPRSAAGDSPVVVWLGYSVHGNETSSGEAAMLTAYYLVANRSAETRQWLQQAVVLIDPAQNPDGRDRAANWHNAWASDPASPDPADKEHVEPFPQGRSNHYFTDLNRDWLALTQQDTRPKIALFHQWYPNVQIDFHEMGKDSTYYFEPSPKSMESPLIPAASYAFNRTLARYHAQSLDALGSLYYTGENFDNFSPVYGSTYPDFHGAVGVTFEQASSRGRVQESANGLLTFAFTIRNHVATGLGTVRGAVAERSGLFDLQKDFFQSALKQAAQQPLKSFVFGDAHDPALTRRLLELLLLHHIEVRALDRAVTVEGQHFAPGSAYVVPVQQPQFRLVHSIFADTPPIKGDVFYGSTSYAIAPAYGVAFAGSRSRIEGGARVMALPAAQGGVAGGAASFAYAFDWRDYNASRLLAALQGQRLATRSAQQPFTAGTAQGEVDFAAGSIVIPVSGQPLQGEALQAAVDRAARDAGVRVHALASGRSTRGIDLGSDGVKALRTPAVALVMGEGVAATEIGSAWFLLDQQLRLPASKLDPAQLGKVPLDRYTTVVLSGGSYASVDATAVAALKRWIQAGGSLVTYGTAAKWAIEQKLADGEQLGKDEEAGDEARRAFGDQRDIAAIERVSGNILSADVDTSHPLAFGVPRGQLAINKENTVVLQPSRNPFSTVVRIDSPPRVNGYLSERNRSRVAGSAWLLVSPQGQGNVVLFADDPAHRKYWHGTERLLINAIFFGNLVNPAKARG
ncbi:M14 family zinc carboxypeptidase [Stenotrophomonas sp. 24(2023)]|uniref:M14 family zinc carboxypeptidase n=1 Tax=Stenotrophomonas sp. 24(2023) TaxID=3068324 RepID=UPI0027DF3B22|nr:M14 family zinc carboxypeptidase [Stenotrophomonas sp. 24(2023)]WMJ67717.1 M14 family zinc carboxypeptidase [Stenotrophomonas sp. 24(2023)]